MKKLFVVIALFATILCGCGRKNASTAPNFVTQVDILCQQNGKTFSIRYTENEKVEAVLLYLRLLKPGRLPQKTPSEQDNSIYEIHVHLSNGEQRLYKQVDHRYMWRKKTGWNTIPAEQASGLYTLLRHYPSDL